MVRGLLRCDEIETASLGSAQESRRHQSRSVVADPVPLRRRSGPAYARTAQERAGNRTVPAKRLQGHSARRRRDASILDANPLQDPVVVSREVWSSNRLPVELAAQYRLPATYGLCDFVSDGGLMSYAPDISDIFGRSASYIDRILKGALPGELPVQAPTKTALVINLKTAKMLSIAIPPTLLALADEVIE